MKKFYEIISAKWTLLAMWTVTACLVLMSAFANPDCIDAYSVVTGICGMVFLAWIALIVVMLIKGKSMMPMNRRASAVFNVSEFIMFIVWFVSTWLIPGQYTAWFVVFVALNVVACAVAAIRYGLGDVPTENK